MRTENGSRAQRHRQTAHICALFVSDPVYAVKEEANLLADLVDLDRRDAMGGPRADPGFVEFAVVDDHDGIYEIPVGSARVYSKSTICVRGGDVAMNDAKTVGRAERFPLKVGRRGRNGHRWDAGEKIRVPGPERVGKTYGDAVMQWSTHSSRLRRRSMTGWGHDTKTRMWSWLCPRLPVERKRAFWSVSRSWTY